MKELKENRYKAYKDRKVREYRELKESGLKKTKTEKDVLSFQNEKGGLDVGENILNSNTKFSHKKSLGQNFLKTESILDLIADSGDIVAGDIILEIGPGEGALTKKILERLQSVKLKSNLKDKNGVVEGADIKAVLNKLICIEKDHRLIPILTDKFRVSIKEGVLTLLEKDILKWSIDEYASEEGINNSLETKNGSEKPFRYKLIANIPYYITGAIVEQFLSADNKPDCIIIMVQKEVAERVTSKDGKQSILSLCTKYYGDSEIIKIVKPGNFNPPPKIDSAILKIQLRQDIININNLSRIELESKKLLEVTYLQIVKKGLAHKRKKLSSNLKDFDKNFDWPELLTNLNLDTNIRGEDLGHETFLTITKEYLVLNK